MKTRAFLAIALVLMLATQLPAQTFSTLYNLTNGAGLFAGLVASGNTLYGTTGQGGTSGDGTAFAVHMDGSSFTVLHSFTRSSPDVLTNSDGFSPHAGLMISGNVLYGTASVGGTSSNGTVFALNTDGTGFTTLHNFTGGSDGAIPFATLVLSSNTLYGTVLQGGTFGGGAVFALNTDGTGFTTLHAFTATPNHSPFTNSDGSGPQTGLILSGGHTLYGTTASGGASGKGTVFAINTDGTDFTNLHSFSGADGNAPYGDLVLSGNTLYGTTTYGGSSSIGTVFAVNTDGSGFSVLHNFTGISDGDIPYGSLVVSSNTLYGMTGYGGSSGAGTAFSVHTDGSAFAVLHNFKNSGDGGYAQAGLALWGNTFYGMTTEGGSAGDGTVFNLSFAPQLTLVASGANVILTWPTNLGSFNFSGFTVQYTTSAVPPFVWTPVSATPVLVNGQYTSTNPISGSQQFYRLSQ
jgi:uncharacterized repeat protein (TIGR03803 family)